MLQPQDLALTIMGAYTREAGGVVWSGGMVQLLGEFGFSASAARAALARLATRDLLARHRSGRVVHYALTPRAEALLARGDERIFSFGRGEGGGSSWTVLWHGIPPDRRVERARLASQLRFLGFGSVQDATWFAAHPRQDEVLPILASLEVDRFTTLLVGRLAPGIDAGALIAAAWDLAAVEAGYRGFLEEFGGQRTAAARRRLDEREAFVVRMRLLDVFRGFPAVDPELPDSMAGHQALRKQVVATFDTVYEGLAETAARHFAAVAQPDMSADRRNGGATR
jgi:phenylacetic acid degradation operon negative regulatory protein